MTHVNQRYVLDSSAVIALLTQEQGADTVSNIITQFNRQKSGLYLSFVTLTEVYYATLRVKGEERARQLMGIMSELPVSVIHSDDKLCLSAGYIKAHFKLSLADAFIAATALSKQAILVHKDPEFDTITDIVRCLRLPMKQTPHG